jgi:hypothetical protein
MEVPQNHKVILTQAAFTHFLDEMDWPFEGKIEPCEVESASKILLSVGMKEVLVFEPQLIR